MLEDTSPVESPVHCCAFSEDSPPYRSPSPYTEPIGEPNIVVSLGNGERLELFNPTFDPASEKGIITLEGRFFLIEDVIRVADEKFTINASEIEVQAAQDHIDRQIKTYLAEDGAADRLQMMFKITTSAGEEIVDVNSVAEYISEVFFGYDRILQTMCEGAVPSIVQQCNLF